MMLSIVIPTIDGRQDELVQTVSAYERRSPGVDIEWIVEVNHPNCGVAWNAGAARARGEYLHITADDIEPESTMWLASALAICRNDCVPVGFVREGAHQFGRDFPRMPFCRREWWVPVAEIHYYSDNHFGDVMRRAGHSSVVASDYDFLHRKSMVGRDESPARMNRDRNDYLHARASGTTRGSATAPGAHPFEIEDLCDADD
jgi:hypothetical protein